MAGGLSAPLLEARLISNDTKAWREKPVRLLEYHEIPPWQQDNEYIITGYRSVSHVANKNTCSHSQANVWLIVEVCRQPVLPPQPDH